MLIIFYLIYLLFSFIVLYKWSIYICAKVCFLFLESFFLEKKPFVRAHAFESSIFCSSIDLLYVRRKVPHGVYMQEIQGILLNNKIFKLPHKYKFIFSTIKPVLFTQTYFWFQGKMDCQDSVVNFSSRKKLCLSWVCVSLKKLNHHWNYIISLRERIQVQNVTKFYKPSFPTKEKPSIAPLTQRKMHFL